MREQGIYHKPNLRKTVEGILYRMRVGCPWRDALDAGIAFFKNLTVGH